MKESLVRTTQARLENIVGKKFYRLTVVAEQNKIKKGERIWLCKCDCGNETVVATAALKSGNTKSCGCLSADIKKTIKPGLTHGLSKNPDGSKTRLFQIWSGMKSRCSNANLREYPRYGGRGISVCDEWLDYKVFYDWALNNGYRDNLTIERINNNGNYDPQNCTWIPKKEQAQNRSSTVKFLHNGAMKTIRELSVESSISYGLLWSRICERKWPIDRAIKTPPIAKFKKVQQ